MGTLARMRTISPYVLVAIALLFIGFMVISDIDLPTITNRSSNPANTVLTSVNGEKIMYNDFEKRVKEQVENARAQSQNPDAVDEANVRDQVWNTMVEEILMRQECKKMGLTVSNDDILDILLESPPEALRRPFTDSTGRFMRDVYLEYVTNPDLIAQRGNSQQAAQQAADFKKYLVQVEDAIRQEKLQFNMRSTLAAAYGMIDPTFVEQRYKQDSTRADVDFIQLNVNNVDSASAAVSDQEISDYYNKNQAQFKIKPVRKMKYALLPIVPSQADSQKVQKRFDRLMNALSAAQTPGARDTTFEQFVTEYSGQVVNYQFVQDIAPDRLVLLNNLPVRGVAGPIRTPQGILFVRLDDRRSGSNERVKASHVLVSFGQNKDSAKAAAERILAEAKSGKDFNALAKQYSKDPSVAQNGGDLGFFAKEQMVKPFADAAFAAAPGAIIGPIETQFGYHIINVKEKKSEEIRYSEIVMNPVVSQATRNTLFRTASTIREQVKNGVPFDSAAKMNGVRPEETGFFRRMSTILGSRTLTNFAFEGNVNDVCEPMEARGAGIVVAQITQSRLMGIKPLEDAKEEIRMKLALTKRLDALKSKAEDVFKKVAGLDSLSKAQGLDSTLKVQTASGVQDNGRVANVGMDAAFTAATHAQPVGKIVGPIRGERGYYIMQVKSRKDADMNAFASARAQLFQAERGKMLNSAFFRWRNELRERADIEDFRSKFYRD